PATPFGERVRRRLTDEIVIWMTTVGRDGTPQPNPVWFLDEGDTILVYNRADALRIAHVQRNPRVTLHFDGNGRGGDVVILAGEAHVVPDEPPASTNTAYVEKYSQHAVRVSGTVEAFATAYPVAIRIAVDRVRGF